MEDLKQLFFKFIDIDAPSGFEEPMLKELMEQLDKEAPHRMVEDDIIANNDLEKLKSKGVNISQVFDDALAKITDKNISKICKNGRRK